MSKEFLPQKTQLAIEPSTIYQKIASLDAPYAREAREQLLACLGLQAQARKRAPHILLQLDTAFSQYLATLSKFQE